MALYDPIAGTGGTRLYPVPWARVPDIDFLIDAEETRSLMSEAGLEELRWQDVTESSIAWNRSNLRPGPLPALGLHLLLGEEWPIMVRNMALNLEAGNVAVVQVVCERRAAT